MQTQTRTRIETRDYPVAIGDRMGFYQIMSEGAVTAAELAQRTGTNTRFAADWLSAQAEEGYVHRDAATGRYANWCALPRAA